MAHYFTNEENLKSEIEKVIAEINGIPFYFYTDNGVFSKGELDFGTELLLKNFKYDNPNNKTLLDMWTNWNIFISFRFYCGYV